MVTCKWCWHWIGASSVGSWFLEVDRVLREGGYFVMCAPGRGGREECGRDGGQCGRDEGQCGQDEGQCGRDEGQCGRDEGQCGRDEGQCRRERGGAEAVCFADGFVDGRVSRSVCACEIVWGQGKTAVDRLVVSAVMVLFVLQEAGGGWQLCSTLHALEACKSCPSS
eukprot:364976-Chlamydomonas_euryale.AAC.17